MGFLKHHKRNVISHKLHEINNRSNRTEAIRSVLEYTVMSSKVQFLDEIKALEKGVRKTPGHGVPLESKYPFNQPIIVILLKLIILYRFFTEESEKN